MYAFDIDNLGPNISQAVTLIGTSDKQLCLEHALAFEQLAQGVELWLKK
jgi:hypothetical protein